MSVHLPILVIINHKVLSSDFRALSVCKLAISTSQPGKHTVTVHNDHQSPALRTRNVRMQTSLPLLKKKKKKKTKKKKKRKKKSTLFIIVKLIAQPGPALLRKRDRLLLQRTCTRLMRRKSRRTQPAPVGMLCCKVTEPERSIDW